MHQRIVVFTDVSVYLVTRDGEDVYVQGRVDFYGHSTHQYHGPVIDPIKVGEPFSFDCNCDLHWGSRKVFSAAVTRIVEHSLRPTRTVPEGYMDITPTWSGALRLLVELREWKGLQDMALAADRYVAAVSLGLITQSDLESIEARRTL